MDVSFKREELLQPLSVAAAVVERRQTLPILSNVLLQVGAAKAINVTATDLEVEVVVRAQAIDCTGEPATANARKLLDICRALPEGTELRLRQEGEKLIVKAGKSRFTLMTLPAADFPAIETTEWLETVELGEGALRHLLEATQFCMAQQDVRYYLNGLLLELSGKTLRAVATDGHRMAIATTELVEPVKGERQVIVPRKAVIELVRSLGMTDEVATVQIGNNHIRMKCGDTTFTAKLVDGRFPDYTKVVPSKQTKHIHVRCADLREALGRVAILSNEKYRGVRLGLEDGVLRMTAHNPEQEEAQEELAVDYKGEALDIGFNVNYLIDAVNALKEGDAELGLNDPNSSCVISLAGSENPRYIIMPMRL